MTSYGPVIGKGYGGDIQLEWRGCKDFAEGGLKSAKRPILAWDEANLRSGVWGSRMIGVEAVVRELLGIILE